MTVVKYMGITSAGTGLVSGDWEPRGRAERMGAGEERERACH